MTEQAAFLIEGGWYPIHEHEHQLDLERAKEFASAQVAAVVATAPADLDTLGELAAALQAVQAYQEALDQRLQQIEQLNFLILE